MAPRKTHRSHEAQLAFEALSIEGGLLSPEWLSRVAALQAGSQSEPDYGVPKGLNLRDEIGRYWRIAQAHWQELAAARHRDADPRASSERFVQALLGQALGFASLAPATPVELAGRLFPIGFAALGGRVPVVIAPAGLGLDTLSPELGDGTRKRTAFGLAQEYLNAAEGSAWGLVSDGASLRIVRDNASLTRPAWIEADLARMFGEERFSDFAALWLLAHETRFGRADQPATECPLETWRNAGREEGTRAREKLRDGVEAALLAVGQGFLSHRDNGVLREKLHAGAITKEAFFQQLLRLVYRLIFLLTAEERGLLYAPGAAEGAKRLHAEGYSLRRLRERSVKRSAHDRYSDLWDGLKIALRGLSGGEPRLGLPALAGLFGEDQCPALDAAKLENRALLAAVFRLTWLREDAGLSRVNWRDMGPEELGSVYESLLELVPQVGSGGRSFQFASGAEAKGNARKTSGSYYTPDSLVQVLLDSALEPVVADTIAANPDAPAEAVLKLTVVDPACGSGHFLVAAARRLAAHVARLEAGGTPTVAEYRHALRRVVGRCIFGVDLNPMALELCKVSLWMEALEPGLPLSFLDSHLQCGNALLGTTPELMAKGIPDAAWEPIEGDDRKVASALKRRNKAEAAGQRTLDFGKGREDEPAKVASAVAQLEAAPDADLSALAAKREQWGALLGSESFRHQKLVADAWCAAFVWPKQPGALADAAPTNEQWRQLRDGRNVPELTLGTVAELAESYHFLHWQLVFPQVFERGGFDVVLGNPPWERLKLQEQEFFASRHDQIATAPNAAARKKLIATLPETHPQLWKEWSAASRRAEGESHLVRHSDRYPLCGKGDVNTYAIFAEHNRSVLGPRGRAGFIVPTGIATDDTTKDFFADLVVQKNLAAFFGFENEAKLFMGIDHRVNFCLFVLSRPEVPTPSFSAFVREPAVLHDPTRVYQLTAADIGLLNPNTKTCPVFKSRRDADINLAIYRSAGVLWREDDEEGNPWGLRFMAMFHMANDSGLFRTRAQLGASGHVLAANRFVGKRGDYLPLIEAKMVYLLNHRFGDFALLDPGEREHILPQPPDQKLAEADYLTHPRYWVPDVEVASRLREAWSREWLLGWRDVTDARSSVRTVVASLIPRVAVAHTSPLMMPSAEPGLVAALYANLCSFALDYCARQKVGGTHLTYNFLKQLAVLAPHTYETATPWSPHTAIRDWLLPRVLELTYTAWDLEAFARDVGYDGPPFRWDPARRFLLRAELDAAFFHLYGISRDDGAYIMETFPIVKRNDEKAHGEYRTKRVILEIYDAMAEAARTGTPYVTRLDPPPADPRVAHPASTRPAWAKPPAPARSAPAKPTPPPKTRPGRARTAAKRARK